MSVIEQAAEARLVPVQPGDLMRYVRTVEPLLAPAIERGGDLAPVDVFREVIAGNMQLWVIAQGGRVVGACVTKVAQRPRRKVVTVVYVGGANMPEWLGLLSEIEGWARAIGAQCVQVVGRKGWKRVLEGYRADSVVLTKDLTDVH